MNRHEELLKHIAARARCAPAPPLEFPSALPARVFASLRGPRAPQWPWETFALRAVPAALCIFLLCLWLTPRATGTARMDVEESLADAFFNEVLAP